MDDLITQLEAALVEEAEAHERLLDIMQRKLRSMREARHKDVAEHCAQENHQLQLVAEIEKRRLILVADLTQRVNPAAEQPMRLLDLAERLDEPARGRLLVRRQQLRERIEQTRKDAGVARRAAESLVQHMQGLMRVVGGAMTGIGVYGRTGAPPAAATAVSTINTTA